MARVASFNSLQHIHLEGSLFTSDTLTLIAHDKAQAQTNEAYQIPSSVSVMDKIGFSYKMAIGLYEDYKKKLENSKNDPWDMTRDFICKFFNICLEWDFETIRKLDCDSKSYPIRRIAYGRIPLAVAPADASLDKPESRYSITNGQRSVSAFQLVQQYLSASGPNNWGIVANGFRIRLLRSTTALSKPQFLEFDLGPILEDDFYSEYAVLWKILHISRIRNNFEGTDLSIWEEWRKESINSGERVRDRLRVGVTSAIKSFGTGFLRHSENTILHEHLQNGKLSVEEYYRQILRLIYRFLFLFVAEERYSDRGLRLIFDPNSTNEAREIYEKGYSLFMLRDFMRKNKNKNLNHHDRWEAEKIVFKALEKGEPRLGLPALGGLFSSELCNEIINLKLANYYFLNAMEALRWSSDKDGRLFWVDYKNLGTQELGSVYESLLEMIPVINPETNEFRFIDDTDEETSAGNARKTTGSYYTPDFFVQQLIKTTVIPVVESKLKDTVDPEQTLLSLTVVDPACGSGHFLISAASTIAVYLSRYRENGETISGYRQAYRDVISHCIYGVDLNPMAVELTKMALWLEGYEPGKPLSFLDSHIKCGNSLVGIFDVSILKNGIPNDAYEPNVEEDKTFCKELKKENSDYLRYLKTRHIQAANLYNEEVILEENDINEMPENTPEEVFAKKKAYQKHLMDIDASLPMKASNFYLAAFFIGKEKESPIPKTSLLRALLEKENLLIDQTRIIENAQIVAQQNNFFNWPLEFPIVFKNGGFDIVLGNPPWDKVKIKAEEFFASRVPEIANAQNGSKRKKLIAALASGSETEKKHYADFIAAQRNVGSQNAFLHLKKEDGGQYPLSGVGDVNLYALFLELTSKIKKVDGAIGIVVPTGFCTDDSTKELFKSFVEQKQVHSIYDFENGNTIIVKDSTGREKTVTERIFPAVHASYKFSLFTSMKSEQADYAFFLHTIKDLDDDRRHFSMTSDEVKLINPNTLTMPIIRSKKDFEIVKKIYSNSSAVWYDEDELKNPYKFTFMRMFDMTNDSHLFKSEPSPTRLPLYEGKLFYHYDHRYNSYEGDRDNKGNPVERLTTLEEKQNPHFELTPQYWVEKTDVYDKFGVSRNTENSDAVLKSLFDEPACKSSNTISKICMGYRSISNCTNSRTLISCILPFVGAGNSIAIINGLSTYNMLLLNANLSSLLFDYAARCKIGGTNINQFYFKQLPVISPEKYTNDEINFIIGASKKLLGTTRVMAEALNCKVTKYEPKERAVLISRLDALYARKYGLSREDFEFILDPAAVMGHDYPTLTFPAIKERDINEFGEYRTKRLCLQAYDEFKESGLWTIED